MLSPACHCLVEDLSEHFYARYDGLSRFILQTYDFRRVAHFDGAAFYTARRYGTAAGDREYVFDRHQERFVRVAGRGRDVFVNCFHQVFDCLYVLRFAVQSAQRGAYDDRSIIAGEAVFVQQITSTWSALFRNTTIAGTPTCFASRMCSRVCGIGPSAADTTRIAPSICAAPVIMFLT